MNWTEVNDTQDALWNTVDDVQYSSYGFLLLEDTELSYLLQESGNAPTRIELNYPAVINPWAPVIDTQTPNWQQVNDTQ
jgi:hypothetical protein